MEGSSMSDMLFPVSIYLIGSILSYTYTRGFLKGKYGKGVVLGVWEISYFFIQIIVFEVLDGRFPDEEVTGIILNVCVLLLMQFLLFAKDTKNNFFVAVSFVAGKETIKYIASVFSFIFAGIWNKVFDWKKYVKYNRYDIFLGRYFQGSYGNHMYAFLYFSAIRIFICDKEEVC